MLESWPEGHGTWAIAGLCWNAKNPTLPIADPYDPGEFGAFPEGRAKKRMHLVRERNPHLVRVARELRLQDDPLLRCEVCNFSYVEIYGERGRGFIEVHHIVPLSELKASTHTRVVDLALLCANCHRIVHRSPTLSISDMRALLSSD